MTGSTVELGEVKRILLPPVWSFYTTTKALIFGHIAELGGIYECSTEPEGAQSKRLMVAGRDVLLQLSNKKIESSIPNILRLREATQEGDLLNPGPKAEWIRHQSVTPHQDPGSLRNAALNSWGKNLQFNTEIRDADGSILAPGLRPSQIGALHAVAAHWIVSKKPGLIVMPTGTGKTEVMLACMVMSRPERLLVVVPSNSLRFQTFRKFSELGVLHRIGLVTDDTKRPVTALLRGTPTPAEVSRLLECNVAVTTVAAIQHLPPTELQGFLDLFDQIYFDEAHHLPSNSWTRLIVLAAHKRILQFTATPFRLDGQRIHGKIIFNFPLRMAQEQGYFKKIKFVDAFDPDMETGDARVARMAVTQLRKDLAANLNHILLVRAETTNRATELFEKYYQPIKDLTPVVFHSKVSGHRKILKSIQDGKNKIVVCVDMFGEGFDLPSLKIAALHDPHKSLAISLQFTGRFTRDAVGIGDATVVANTADLRVSDAIEELYAEDPDWNRLIPDLSAKAIDSQINFSEFLDRMDNKLDVEEELFSLNVLQPKISTVIYSVKEFRPNRYKKWAKNIHVEREWISKDKDLLLFITKSRPPIEWASIKDTTNEIWNLFILAYEEQDHLLFIHSSQKASLYQDLAEAVSGDSARLLEGERMFRAFHGLSRLLFYNVGLYSKGSKLRFRMYTGLDIAEAIDPTTQTTSTKSNLFGIGYEQGELTSVGVSHKGRVWSMTSGSIPDWREWCRKIGKKIRDATIPTNSYLQHTLIPREIAALPGKPLFLIAFPSRWYKSDTETMRLFEGGVEKPAHSFEIQSFVRRDSKTLELLMGWNSGSPHSFNLVWGPKLGEFHVEQKSASKIEVNIAGHRRNLADFLTEDPPTVYLLDGSEVHGAKFLEPPTELECQFNKDRLIEFDWVGVDIQQESKWKAGQVRPNSVQARLIRHLIQQADNAIVFDDDDPGEIADVVRIEEGEGTIRFQLYHCKYAGGKFPGVRVKDPAEVCMQAVRSLRWVPNPKRILGQLMLRERTFLNGRPTRIEQGNMKALASLKRRLRKLHVKAEVFVVQPGISKSDFTPEISTMLGAANNLIQAITGTGLKVIASR